MKTSLFDQKGNVIGDIELQDVIFGLEGNDALVHRALIYQLSNDRVAVAHTKTRGERRGSTRKIYRQKGTGRARMGANRSPVRKKGGVVFGPSNAVNFQISMNRKERRKALFTVLSGKLANEQLKIVDSISFDSIKTKNMVEVCSALSCEKSGLIAIAKKDVHVEKSASNLPGVKTILSSYLNVKDLLKYQQLVITKEALEQISALVK